MKITIQNIYKYYVTIFHYNWRYPGIARGKGTHWVGTNTRTQLLDLPLISSVTLGTFKSLNLSFPLL